MNHSLMLERYATLAAAHGLNVQPGQICNIACEAYHRELAYLIAKSCYDLGAAYVNIDLIEPRLQRLRVDRSTEEQMRYVPAYLAHKYRELVDERAANVRIVGLEDPDLLSDADPRKLNVGRIAVYENIRYLYEEGIGKSRLHWNVLAAPTPQWAKRIFPNDDAAVAEQKLWQQLFKICRVDREDYLAAWKKHNSVLQERAKRLTSLKIDSLHFTGPGTDLIVGLSQKAIFKGGGEMGPRGVEFEPNIPTEECFTTPDFRRTSGEVRATRPFLINGKLIEGLQARFEQGKLVKFSAREGEATFREYIGSDAGACRLGEVALVGIDSPIYRSGLIFEEILLDENAACHIAVGSAYKFCLEGGSTLTKEQIEALGCNESSVHTDMMISSEEVDVTAKLYDGRTISLIKKGEWVSF